MIIVRYADDFIVGFPAGTRSDARRFLEEMRERLGKFALFLHPEKTWLIEFGRFAAEHRKRRGLPADRRNLQLLGFTFISGADPLRRMPATTGKPTGAACRRRCGRSRKR